MDTSEFRPSQPKVNDTSIAKFAKFLAILHIYIPFAIHIYR